MIYVMKQSASAYVVVGKAAWTFADKCYFYVSRTDQSLNHSFKNFSSSWCWNCISQYPTALTMQDVWKLQLCHEDCLILPSIQLALYFFYAMQRRCVKYSHHLSILHTNFFFTSVPIPLDTFGLSSFHVPLGPSSRFWFYCLCWLIK
jgi:hypothetical protein